MGAGEKDLGPDESYMGMALEEAELAAAEGEVPIGAVVVCDGRVVARAHNRREAGACRPVCPCRVLRDGRRRARAGPLAPHGLHRLRDA